MDLFFKIAGWVFFAIFTIGAFSIIGDVGKECRPITPKVTMGATALNAALLLWIYWAILRGS